MNEPIILVPASRVYPPIVTAPASPTMDQDTQMHKGEPNLYLEPTCLETYRPDTQIHQGEPNLYLEPAKPRQPNPTTVRMVQLQVRETSPSGSMNRTTRDTEQPGDISRGCLDCLTSRSGAALYSAKDSIPEPNHDCDQEQLEYQYRTMAPGEEELLRDTPEPSTPPVQSPIPRSPLTPGAARITEGAFYEPTEDLGAVVDELQALVEELLPRLKLDISSFETSNPRTPSPDKELEDLSESKEATPENPTPELLDGVFKFRDPEPLQLDESGKAVQEHMSQE